MSQQAKTTTTSTSTTTTTTRITQDTPPAINKQEFRTLKKAHTTKSAMIRALAAQGLETNMIAHTLLHYGILSPNSAYQHVRNVLVTPLKRRKT